MDFLVSTFHIDWRLMIAQIVNFAVVILVLYYFAFRPLMKIMDDRSKTIAEGLQDAQESARQLEESRTEHKKVTARARAEAEQILNAARRDAEAEQAAVATRSQAEVERLLAQGRQQMEREKSRIIEEARREVAELVVMTAEKVLPSSISPLIDSKIVRANAEKITS